MGENLLNPFLYGMPVPPPRFIGRNEAVRTLFSRLENGESTAVVGEPRIGKSSLLRYIADETVRSEWLKNSHVRSTFVDIDCHLLQGSYSPNDFWQHTLNAFQNELLAESVQVQLGVVRQSGFGSFTLEMLFKLLERNRMRVVLVIDEFDSLLHHPGFNTAEFFGALRGLSSRTGGLALVTASRLSLADMNRRTEEINPLGSPFFNTIAEVRLPPLKTGEVEKLLDQTLEGTGVIFSPKQRLYIVRLAGRHPYLIQAGASAMFDAILDGKTETDLYQAASSTMLKTCSTNFDDLWRHLTPEAQTATVVLSLSEVKGHVDERDFDTNDICNMDWYGPELRRLADLGLVEREEDRKWHTDWGNFAIWHGNRWRVTAGIFVWWVTENAVAKTRKPLDFEKWLHDREYEGILTRGAKDHLKELASGIPSGVLSGSGKILETLLKSWVAGIGA